MKIRPLPNRKGVTLVELLVGLVISGIVVAGVYRVFVSQTKAYSVQDQVVEVQQNIRSAMEILLRDLRMAGYDDDSLNSKITVATPITPADDSVTVQYEYDPTHRYQVRYYLLNDILKRELKVTLDTGAETQTTEDILENVNQLTFTYDLDTNGDRAVENWGVSAVGIDPAKIVAVHVTLQARPTQVNPDVAKMVMPRILTSRVALRNRCLR